MPQNLSSLETDALNAFYGIPQEATIFESYVFWFVAIIGGVIAVWYYLQPRGQRRPKHQQPPRNDNKSSAPEREDAPQKRDPYETLGARRGASIDEVRQAYRDRIKEYHPDKVAGLGKELREVAERKAKEINSAFDELKRAYGVL